MSTVDWRCIGAKTMRRITGVTGAYPAGLAAWRLRAPRKSPEDWTIEAKHCPYLGRLPYAYGDDAWRISLQRHDVDQDRWAEVGHFIATSEAEAFEAVRYFAALADMSAADR